MERRRRACEDRAQRWSEEDRQAEWYEGPNELSDTYWYTREDKLMRNVIYAINVTLDGCCEHTKFNPDDDLLDHYTSLLRDDAGLLVYGRKTYQLMVPYWPDIAKSQSETNADIEFAQAFVSKKKVVFSRSLASAGASADDGNTSIVRTNLRDEILKLKQEPGKNILVGGVDIPTQLMELGLIDEYRIVVAPVIVGQGRRLFDGVKLAEKWKLKLVESKAFKSGAVALRYLKQ
jgi:dihydrofolate reductase